MGKTGICKGDIVYIDLKESDKYIQAGIRPCVVVSSAKSLLKNETISICPTTTKVNKKTVFHLEVSGFGLSKNSIILTEQIRGINRSSIIKKIGTLDNKKLNELNCKLNLHLNISEKKMDVEGLMMVVNNIDKECELLKGEMYVKFLEEKYEECKELSKQLIKIAKKHYYKWYSYYTLSLIDVKENNYSLENIEKAMHFLGENEDHSKLTLWGYGRLLEEVNKDKAIEIYINLAEAYRLDDQIQRLSVLSNILRLKGRKNSFKRLVEVAKELDYTKTYIEKESLIKSLESEYKALI